MKMIAETKLGHTVKKAVITLPAYFMESRWKATMEAGLAAGFEQIYILTEPVAAALHFAYKNPNFADILKHV